MIISSKCFADFKQYGIIGFAKRIFKAILRKIGIDYESFYYMVNDIDYPSQCAYWETHKIEGARELTLADFTLADPTWYTPHKAETYSQRLKNGYKAYGVMDQGRLIYSCMLSFEQLVSSQNWISVPLASNEALLLDAYCAPEGRGRGLHGAMNAYRLMKAYEAGKTNCIVIILKENTPAFKSQIKVGFHVAFTYYTLTLWGHHFTNLYKQYTSNH